jgi:hypothetical protein
MKDSAKLVASAHMPRACVSTQSRVMFPEVSAALDTRLMEADHNSA